MNQQGQMEERPHGEVRVLTDRVPLLKCRHCSLEINVSEVESFCEVECPSCGTFQVVPARLGQYLLVDLISTGGMGGVFFARDEQLGRDVAIKVMLQSLGSNAEFVENFKREAQAAARLNHPNIAQIYAFGQEKGQPYIVMELVSGRRFDKMVGEGKPLDPVLVLRIAVQVAEGLKAAGEGGLIHGDIKPENILLDEKNQAKLVDFGLASYANQASAGGIWGTPYYIAPEKVRRQRVDERSDIYSLGATMYHALAGKAPFEGETPVEVVRARLDHPAPPLSQAVPGIAPQVESVVARMLQLEPGMRHPTYASLISDLHAALEALGAKPGGGSLTGKRLILKKKGAAPPSDAAPTADRPPEPAAGGGGKIVIRKLSGAPLTPPAAEAKPDAAEPPARRGVPGWLKGLFWVLLAAAVLGGGAWLALYYKKRGDVARAGRAEAAELEKRRAEAAGVFLKVRDMVTNITAMARAAELCEDDATNSVLAVLGEALVPEPAAPPALPPEPVGGAAAGSTDAPAATAPINAAAVPTNAAIPAAGADGGPPPGVMGTDEIRKAKEKDAGAAAPGGTNAPATAADTNAAAAVETGAAVETPAAAPEAPAAAEPPAEEPEIKTRARKVMRSCATIREGAGRAAEIETQAVAARDAAAAATNAAVAVAETRKLEGHAEALGRIARGCAGALAEARREADAVVRLMDGALRQRDAEELARAAAEKKREEEEARKQQEEAQRAAEEAEILKVEIARQGVMTLIHQHSFKEAVRTLKRSEDEYQTARGKEAFAFLVKRYERLTTFKEFIIRCLNAQPYQWGWGQGAGATDVLGADDLSVKLKDRRVPWREVPAAQVLKFADHYLESRDVKIREQGENSLGAAIYCAEVGGEKGMAKAQTYVAKAVKNCPYLTEEANRIVPPTP